MHNFSHFAADTYWYAIVIKHVINLPTWCGEHFTQWIQVWTRMQLLVLQLGYSVLQHGWLPGPRCMHISRNNTDSHQWPDTLMMAYMNLIVSLELATLGKINFRQTSKVIQDTLSGPSHWIPDLVRWRLSSFLTTWAPKQMSVGF